MSSVRGIFRGFRRARTSPSPRVDTKKKITLSREVDYEEHQVFLTNAPLYKATSTAALTNAFWHGLSDPACQLPEDMKGFRILTQLERVMRAMTASPDFALEAAYEIIKQKATPDIKAAIEQLGPCLDWPEKTIEQLYNELVGVTADGAPRMLFPEFLALALENVACIIKCVDFPIFLERSLKREEWTAMAKSVGLLTVGAVGTAGSITLGVFAILTVVGAGFAPLPFIAAGAAAGAGGVGAVDMVKFVKGSVQTVYYAATSVEHAFDMQHMGGEILKENRHLTLSILKALHFCNDQLSEGSEPTWEDVTSRRKLSTADKVLKACNRSGGRAHSMDDVISMDLNEWVALDPLGETEYFKHASPEIRKMASLALMSGFCIGELLRSDPERQERKKTIIVAGFGNAGKSTLVEKLTGRTVPDIGDRKKTTVPRSYCVLGSNSERLIDTPAIDDHDDNVGKTTFHLIDSRLEVNNVHIMFMVAFDRVSSLVTPMAEIFNRACAMQVGEKLNITVLLHKFQSHKEATADDAIQFLHATETDWEEAIKEKINTDRIELKVVTSDVLEHQNLKPELKGHVADLAKIQELIRS